MDDEWGVDFEIARGTMRYQQAELDDLMQALEHFWQSPIVLEAIAQAMDEAMLAQAEAYKRPRADVMLVVDDDKAHLQEVK
ncbi:hypothetical protein [Lacticaseibacillus manihotivorans]|uniref:Uncharacterized protein n=2 Tax=Lacticaseibacillus manihotivorans TaxID=88233 RepID=A0A0R1QR12_9LACO|nr:hypothetical protein [Lacticaseibacillus manihotivorans]KRL47142.1 hypothetical protein FD01_GL000410 [Lacticaseibacillus manihotivorans DSM 13343 = JCM 12514]QFQ90820.1 hypothetical protein LM010_05025 [Lacticaseibacillus manihotivorans]